LFQFFLYFVSKMPGGHPHAKKRNDVLGKAIIKAAIKSRTQKRKASAGGTGFHVADLENSRNPLQSVTEISSMEEFMAAASMAERDFTAERATVRIVSDEALPNAAQRAKGTTGAMSGSFGPLTLRETPSGSVKSLRIPRRPKWDGKTSAEDLQRMEKDAFLAWRRALATEELKHGAGVLGAASSNDEAHVTPFEKNIEVWRQLWRVVERADVLVQIVDARNPLLYRCGDLEEYVRDVNPLKSVLLLVNKADFLTPTQRLAWARYFASQGVPFIFFSAKREQERLEELDRMQRGLSTRRDLISDVFVAEAVRTASKGALLRERIAKATESRDMYGSLGEEDEENEDEIENEEEEEEDVEDVTVGPDNSISIASALTRRRIGAFTDYNVNEDEDEENDEEEEEEAKNKYSEEIEDNDEVEEVNISTSILDLNDNEPQTDVNRVNSTTEGDQSEQRRRREGRGGGGNIKQTDQSLSQTVPLPIPVNSANTCEVENDPLSAACHVYTRDELIDFLTENFKSTSLGSSNAASRKRREELRTRQREEARAARKDELKRRREMHQRMVEIGLGAHVRFGGESDALALGEDEEDEEGAAMFEDEEDEEDQPLQVGMVGYPNVGKSSTINALLGVTSVSHGMQRVAVASTPGKTKHFQTLSLNSEITLVDWLVQICIQSFRVLHTTFLQSRQ
jgi:ribosome biogenesis GTPase A